MIKGLVFLASYSSGSNAIGGVLDSWEKAGVFEYMLPFLLIFSLVFGILSQINIFKEQKNRAINAIIALVVALMALQFGFVSTFFSQVLPRLGIGLVVLLVVMVLIGLFAPNRTWVTYTLFAAAAIILVIVLANTASATQWFSTGFLSGINWQNLLPWIILIVLLAVVVASSFKKDKPQDVSSKFMKLLGADEK